MRTHFCAFWIQIACGGHVFGYFYAVAWILLMERGGIPYSLNLEFAAWQSSWPRTESWHFQTSAEKTFVKKTDDKMY